jgi:hypothetical protein
MSSTAGTDIQTCREKGKHVDGSAGILVHNTWTGKERGKGTEKEKLANHYLNFGFKLSVIDIIYGKGPEVVCTVRLAIGFKQMLFIFATCYWF